MVVGSSPGVGKVEKNFIFHFFLILWFGVVGSIPGIGKVEIES